MIIDHCRNRAEFKEFFEAYPMPETEQFSFEWCLNNPNLFCFYDEETGRLLAYIVISYEEGKNFLSGASCRKNFLDNIEGIIKVCNAFDDDIYSYTRLKHAALLLKKAGFKKIDDNLFVRYKNGQKI